MINKGIKCSCGPQAGQFIKKGLSLLNPSPPQKSLLSPPVWLCLGSKMPALMNTNFPFRSIHQHVKLHFVSFWLYCRHIIVIYFIGYLLIVLIWMKMTKSWFCSSLNAWKHHKELMQDLTWIRCNHYCSLKKNVTYFTTFFLSHRNICEVLWMTLLSCSPLFI